MPFPKIYPKTLMVNSSPQTTEKKLFVRSLHFFSGTLLSRLSGLGRDIAMAYSFGASPAVSLFMVAFRFSNLPRRLFGEGALQSILIARYEELKNSVSNQVQHQKAAQFYKDSVKSWAVALSFFILFLYGLIFTLDRFLLDSPNQQAISHYCKLMLPGLWFICMSAVNDAYLKSHRRFLFASSAPASFNIVWIIAAVLFSHIQDSKAMSYLSLGVIVAFATQWLLTYMAANSSIQKLQIKKTKGRLFSSEVKKLAKPLLLGIVGVGALQVNALLDSLFAMYAEISGPAYLWFAIRIEQAPLSLIGLAISSASLPSLAAAIKREDFNKARKIFSTSYEQLTSLMLMICCGMFSFGLPAIRFALEHGGFTPYQSIRTTQCLWAYSLGLIAQCATFLYQNTHFSLGHYRLVTRCSLYTVFLNLMLNALFVMGFKMDSSGVALATSISAVFQLILLRFGLHKTNPSLFFKANVRGLFKSIIAIVASFIFGLLTMAYLYELNPLDLLVSQDLQLLNERGPINKVWDLLVAFSLWALFYIVLLFSLALKKPWKKWT